jgi:type II secretory pathway pseudopilin PulG
MNRRVNQTGKQRSNQGFSLLEMMIAVGVMAIAMIGGLAMVVIGMGRNSSMRMDTTSANVAQTVLEEIASARPNSDPTLNITDCTGNPLTITTAAGGAALQPDPPNLPSANPGDIDFTAAAVANYSATYVMCAPGGGQVRYEVRWNIQKILDPAGTKSWGKLVTVAARQPLAINNGTMNYSPPVTLRTVVGM